VAADASSSEHKSITTAATTGIGSSAKDSIANNGTSSANVNTKKRSRDTTTNNTSANNTSIYTSKSEAIAAFKGLLLAKNITPTHKFIDVQKLCHQDVRWTALSSTGERKQALAEYQTKRSNELLHLKRMEIQRGKEAYTKLLQEHEIQIRLPATQYEDIRSTFLNDDRFHALNDEELRRELFYDYKQEVQKRREREKRWKERQSKNNYVSFLTSLQNDGRLSYSSTYPSFVASLTEKEKQHLNADMSVSESDRQHYFAEYILQLQSIHETKQQRIHEATVRAEKAQRQQYRESLGSLAKEGRLRLDTRWRDIQSTLTECGSYEAVYAQRREGPKDLFHDFMEEWKKVYCEERGVLLRALSLGVGKEDRCRTFEEFTSHLLEVSSSQPDLYTEVRRIVGKVEEELLSSSCRLLFEERKEGNGRRDEKDIDEGEESSEDEGEIIE
jgi:pre-mRNA-processing factor 40